MLHIKCVCRLQSKPWCRIHRQTRNPNQPTSPLTPSHSLLQASLWSGGLSSVEKPSCLCSSATLQTSFTCHFVNLPFANLSTTGHSRLETCTERGSTPGPTTERFRLSGQTRSIGAEGWRQGSTLPVTLRAAGFGQESRECTARTSCIERGNLTGQAEGDAARSRNHVVWRCGAWLSTLQHR